MHLSFVYPLALWLLLLLAPLWALAIRAPRRLSRGRFWLSLVLRSLLFVALVGSLAGTQVVRRVDELTTVFLVDSSDSVAPEARAQAEQFIQQALSTMPERDRGAIVVFGENALVERAPSYERGLRRLLSVPVVSRTNIGSALELGLALLPADTQKRLVLLSDGGENSGDARTALEFARARNVPIDIVNLQTATGNDLVQIEELRAPAQVRKGQTVNVEVVVSAAGAGQGTLRLLENNTLLREQTVSLQPGRQTFNFQVNADVLGFTRYSAEIELAGDERRENNQAAALVDVAGEPRVLVVEGTSGDTQNLAAALTSAQMNPQTIAPEALPSSLAGLASYDAVALVNVPAGALPSGAMQLLPSYVQDLGRGLVMIGGDRSFGVGGYANTPIEKALPVDMEVKDTTRRPDVALVFVVDKSGSMAACHCNGANMEDTRREGGVQKVDIGKDAVLQASALLRPNDKLGVVAFDDAPHWAVEIAEKPSSDEVLAALRGIAPNGTTNVRSGLLAAKAALEKTTAKVKHIILLTDGWSSGSDNLDLAREMRDAGITLSTVAAGGGSAPYLERLAQTGGGRYYPAEAMEDVPQIFVDETMKVAGSYIMEQAFLPALSGDSPILRGLTDQGWPQLLGFNGTEAKPTSQIILRAPDNYPLLAQWQYGLGRAVAWTSDMKGQWGRELVGWERFGTFAAQLVAWTVPRQEAGQLAGNAKIEGLQAVVTANVENNAGQPATDATVSGILVGADGVRQDLTLRQVAPGQFQATVPSPATGSYLVQLAASQAGQQLGSTTLGLVVPYSPEYRQREANPELLQTFANETGGRVLTTPGTVFQHDVAAVQRACEIGLPLLLLVALLFPFDIAARRLMLRRDDFAGLRRLVPRRGSQASTAPLLGQLQRAKARAQTRSGSIDGPASPTPAAPLGNGDNVRTVGQSRAAGGEQMSQAVTVSRPAQAAPSPSAMREEALGPTDAPEADAMARLRAAKARAKRNK